MLKRCLQFFKKHCSKSTNTADSEKEKSVCVFTFPEYPLSIRSFLLWCLAVVCIYSVIRAGTLLQRGNLIYNFFPSLFLSIGKFTIFTALFGIIFGIFLFICQKDNTLAEYSSLIFPFLMIGSAPVFELFTGSLHYLKWLLPLLSFFFLAFAFLNHILLNLLCSDSFRTDTILYLAINTWAINYIFKFLSLNIWYLHSEIFIYGVGVLVLYGYLSFRYYSALKFLVPQNHSLFLIFLVLSGLISYLWTGYQSARAFTDIYQLDSYRLSAAASTGINHVPLFFLLTTVFLFLLLLIGSLIWAARRSRTYMGHALICAMIIFLCIQIAIPLFYGCGSSSQNTAFTGGISVYFLGLSDRIYPVTGTALAVLLNRFLNNRRSKEETPVDNPDSVPPINAHE